MPPQPPSGRPISSFSASIRSCQVPRRFSISAKKERSLRSALFAIFSAVLLVFAGGPLSAFTVQFSEKSSRNTRFFRYTTRTRGPNRPKVAGNSPPPKSGKPCSAVLPGSIPSVSAFLRLTFLVLHLSPRLPPRLISGFCGINIQLSRGCSFCILPVALNKTAVHTAFPFPS